MVGATSPQLLTPLAFLTTQAPGATGSFAYDLTSGRYDLVCLLKDPDGSGHLGKGMASEFRAGPAPGPASSTPAVSKSEESTTLPTVGR